MGAAVSSTQRRPHKPRRTQSDFDDTHLHEEDEGESSPSITISTPVPVAKKASGAGNQATWVSAASPASAPSFTPKKINASSATYAATPVDLSTPKATTTTKVQVKSKYADEEDDGVSEIQTFNVNETIAEDDYYAREQKRRERAAQALIDSPTDDLTPTPVPTTTAPATTLITEQQLLILKQQHQVELDTLRTYTTTLETSLTTEKSVKQQLELDLHTYKTNTELQIHKLNKENTNNITDIEHKIRLECDNKYNKLIQEKENIYTNEIETLKIDYLTSQTTLHTLQQEYNTLQTQLTNIQNNTEDKQQYNILLTDLEMTKKRLIDESEELKAYYIAESEHYTSENKALTDKLATLTHNITALQTQYDINNTRLETLTNERDSIQIALIQSTQQLQVCEGDLIRIKTECNIYKQDNESLVNDVQKLKSYVTGSEE